MKKAKLLRVWRMLNRIGAILFGMIYLGCLLFWEVNPTFCYSTVSSGSMAPNINAGDCVIWDYRPVNQDEIKVGDVIRITKDGEAILTLDVIKNKK